jgi:hypothetical protein
MDRYFAELSRTAADRIAKKQAEEEASMVLIRDMQAKEEAEQKANMALIRDMQAKEEAEQKANMALIRDMQADEDRCVRDRHFATSISKTS